MSCCVLSCVKNEDSAVPSADVTFYKIPKEYHLKQLWTEAIGIPEWQLRPDSEVCSAHFGELDFTISETGEQLLVDGAVPHLCLYTLKDLQAAAEYKTCRVCLGMDRKMYHIRDHNLHEAYEIIVGVRVKSTDRLPQMLCWECTSKLMAFKIFKGKAQKSQLLLSDKLADNSILSVGDIKSINRVKYNLNSHLTLKYNEPTEFITHLDEDQDDTLQEIKIEHNHVKTEPTSILVEEYQEDKDVKVEKCCDGDSNYDSDSSSDNHLIPLSSSSLSLNSDKPKSSESETKQGKKRPVIKEVSFAYINGLIKEVKEKKRRTVEENQEDKNVIDEKGCDGNSNYDSDSSSDSDLIASSSSSLSLNSDKPKSNESETKQGKKRPVIKEVSFAYINGLIKEVKEQMGRKVEENHEDKDVKDEKGHCDGDSNYDSDSSSDSDLIASSSSSLSLNSDKPKSNESETKQGKKRPVIKEVSFAYINRLIKEVKEKKGRKVEKKRMTARPVVKPELPTFDIRKLTLEEQLAAQQARASSAAYLDAPHKCDVCYRGFQSARTLALHAVRHSDKCGKIECVVCKHRFRVERVMRLHVSSTHAEQYSCKTCSFVTPSRLTAVDHQKWHAGNTYTCPHCPATLTKFTSYLSHLRIKHSSRFACELCGYTFVSKHGVQMHKAKRHVLDTQVKMEGPYCEECKLQFASDEAYQRHLTQSSVHSSDTNPDRIRNNNSIPAETPWRRKPGKVYKQKTKAQKITCEQCGEHHNSYRTYAKHFREAHPGLVRTKYKGNSMCEQCGRIFPCKAFLQQHMAWHSGKYKCDVCGKSFATKYYLAGHLRVHDEKTSNRCPYCKRQFSSHQNCLRHVKAVHEGEKPWQCEICSKKFSTAKSKQDHVDHVHHKKPWPKRVRVRAPSAAKLSEQSSKQLV